MTTPIISGHTGAPYARRGRFGIEGAKVKLTLAQEKAMAELTHEWKPANRLHARLSTLNALAARGLAEELRDKAWRSAAWSFVPRSKTSYKLAGGSQ